MIHDPYQGRRWIIATLLLLSTLSLVGAICSFVLEYRSLPITGEVRKIEDRRDISVSLEKIRAEYVTTEAKLMEQQRQLATQLNDYKKQVTEDFNQFNERWEATQKDEKANIAAISLQIKSLAQHLSQLDEKIETLLSQEKKTRTLLSKQINQNDSDRRLALKAPTAPKQPVVSETRPATAPQSTAGSSSARFELDGASGQIEKNSALLDETLKQKVVDNFISLAESAASPPPGEKYRYFVKVIGHASPSFGGTFVNPDEEQGHAYTYNRQMSEQRAQAVAEFITGPVFRDATGINLATEDISVVGKGYSEPVLATPDTPPGECGPFDCDRSQRVEIIVEYYPVPRAAVH